VGPLPWLSKSRLRGPRETEDFLGLSCGHLVGYPDSGVPNDRLLGNAHVSRAPLEA